MDEGVRAEEAVSGQEEQAVREQGLRGQAPAEHHSDP